MIIVLCSSSVMWTTVQGNISPRWNITWWCTR